MNYEEFNGIIVMEKYLNPTGKLCDQIIMIILGLKYITDGFYIIY